MLSKFSVKRPYTVLVAVVMAITLGVIAFGNMHTDLLPKMEFPYAIVVTTYPGASPEEVEENVTKPVEQAMSSISNIKQVSSVSQDNASMVILEFNQSTNMDSVTIEMRESLDSISGNWDDSIGNPSIMKINPDMMPIMVAAVAFDGEDAVGATDRTDKEVTPELESVEGVASVTATGDVTEKVDVILNQKKIDEMNDKVKKALEKSFAEGEDKISDSQDKISSGKETLTNKQEESAQKMADGESKLVTASKKLDDTSATLESQLETVKKQKTEVSDGLKTLNSSLKTLKENKAKLLVQKTNLEAAIKAMTKLSSSYDFLANEKTKLENEIAANGGEASAEQQEQLSGIEQKILAIDTQLKAMNLTSETLAAKITESNTGLSTIKETITTLDTNITKLTKQQKSLKTALTKVNAGISKIQKAQKKVASGIISMEDAKTELSKQKVLASIKLSVAEVQLTNGEAKLADAKQELKDKKQETFDKVDLDNLLTMDLVKNILTAENFSMPAGYVTEEGVKYLVRVGDKVDSAESMEDLVIMDFQMDDVDPIRLSDVADVATTNNSDEVYTKINGTPGVALVMQKQTGYSTGDVTDRLLDKFETLEKNTEGLHITTLMNQGIYIDLVVNSVVENLIFGGLLAILILLFFLKDIKPTFVVALSIPLSLVTAVVLMYFSGVTLNIISLSGLALGVGMLVDNSIVVIENIYRLRKEGYSAKKASVEGAKQVAGAILASTLTTVCVFAPIAFTEGITRQLFVDLALTLGYSLLASLVVALTLVPAVCSGLLKKVKDPKPGIIERIQDFYGKVLRVTLKYKAVVLIVTLVLFVLSAFLAVRNGTSFIPTMESNQMTVTLTADKEKSFEDTGKLSDEVIDKMMKIEGIDTVGAMVGGSSMASSLTGGSSSANSVSMYVLLKEDKKQSSEEIKAEILEQTKDIDCELEVNTSAMDMSALGTQGIAVQIKGKDLDKLKTISEDVMKLLEKVDGLEGISNGLEESTDELRITVNKGKAMEHSLTVAQVFQAINAKISEANKATKISTDTKDYDVYVRNQANEELTREDIKKMKIEVTNQEGKKEKIKISDIADFEDATAANTINRESQVRYVNVTANVKDDYNIGIVGNKVRDALKGYDAPAGYSIDMQGEDESINEALYQVMLMFVVGVLFMYLIMVAQFQSLLSPFIILFTIPLAFTGGFLGLVLTGADVSVIAAIGFVMLSGIIVNNGIVLVDYVNQLRRGGMEKREAIVEAGRTRLRPILMTALTTILGLSTMAMGLGMGADMVQPMAIVVIGGMIYGTLLTLFIVPCIYDILNRKKSMVEEEI